MDPPIRQRRRPALSCVLCRQRKIKCDRKVPCRPCVASGNQFCTYRADQAPPRRRYDTASTPAASTSSVDSQRPPGVFVFNASSNTEDNNPITQPQESQTIRELASKIQDLEKLLSETKQQNNAVNNTLANPDNIDSSVQSNNNLKTPKVPKAEELFSANARDESRASRSRFFGHTNWMVMFSQFEILQDFSKEPEWDESRALLQQCKATMRAIKSESKVNPHPLPNPRDYIPPRQLCDELVQLYLRTFETTYRILHVPTFMKAYRSFWEDSAPADTIFVTKLLLVIAVGAAWYQGDSPLVSRPSTVSWVSAARTWLQAPFEKAQLSFDSIQLQCLLALARQANDIGADTFWASASNILTMALNMGLHRDPGMFPGVSVFEAEMRRRVWATVLEFAVQSNPYAGLPLLLSSEDYDCRPPSNLDDCDFDETTTTLPESKPADVFTQTSWQLALLGSVSIRINVARVVNKIHSQPTYDEVIKLHEALTEAYRAIPSFFRPQNLESQYTSPNQPTSFQVYMLDHLTRRYLIHLHCLYAARAGKSPQFYLSRKVCLDSSLALLSYPPIATILPKSSEDFARLRTIGGGMFKEDFFHASVLICAELQMQASEEYSYMSNELKKPLLDALDRFLGHVAQRLGMGKDSAKGHFFLSIIIAQLRGRNVREAARMSSKMCLAAWDEKLERIRSWQFNGNSGSGNEIGNPDPYPTPLQSALVPETELNFDISDSWILDGWDYDFP
ncbi:hypothetical protein BP6252_03912 [Coleophoma cylindrospora]|uniref:Zn(2)-C6 fungal-type domain-containing protein n=1 Tax=Coleophoma cylindrospora TaxID=1849047 RepID=A0A3D8S988_9HELO|nr:hypothetical protein BP6252_03912 [Coleophoma cylindrospora]